MDCFGTTDFDNNSRLITLSAIIIRGLHCILKSSRLSQVALSTACLRMSRVPTCSAQRLYGRGDYGSDFVSLYRTAAERPVLMLLFGLHLKVSWSFLLFRADVINRSLNKTECDKDDCCIAGNWNSAVWTVRVAFLADWSQGMLAIIRCTVFCVPVCYPEI